jgi:hypothetical protein
MIYNQNQIIKNIKNRWWFIILFILFQYIIVMPSIFMLYNILSTKLSLYNAINYSLNTIIEVPVSIKSQTFYTYTQYEFTKSCNSDITLPSCDSIINATINEGYCRSSYYCCKSHSYNNKNCVREVDFAVTKYKIIKLYDIILTLEWNNKIFNYTVKSSKTNHIDKNYYVLYMINLPDNINDNINIFIHYDIFNNVIDNLYNQSEYEKLIVFNKTIYSSENIYIIILLIKICLLDLIMIDMFYRIITENCYI